MNISIEYGSTGQKAREGVGGGEGVRRRGGGRRGYSQKSWTGVCGPFPKTLTLFMTKIFDFCYPCYDRCGWHGCRKHKLWRASVDGLIDNDEKVAPSKKHTEFKTRVQKPYPICDQNCQSWCPIYDQIGWKTILFGAVHTYVAHIREYPPPGTCSAMLSWISQYSICEAILQYWATPQLFWLLFPLISRLSCFWREQ